MRWALVEMYLRSKTRLQTDRHVQSSGSDTARMPMGTPISTDSIHLNRATDGCLVGDLDYSIPKIRAGFVVPESRMQHPQRTAIQRTKSLPLKALALP